MAIDWGLNIINSHEMVCALCNQPINLNDKKIVNFPRRLAQAAA